MEILALLSNRDDLIIKNVKSVLGKYTVYPLKALEELEDLYSNIPLNLLIIDTVSHRLSSVKNFLNKLDENIVVLITTEKLDRFEKEELPKSVYDTVSEASLAEELFVVVERALEWQKFGNELRLLKQSQGAASTGQMPADGRVDTDFSSPPFDPDPGEKYGHKKVIVNFAKMLTASFDMRKLFDHFMNSVIDIAHVGKMSVLLKDKDGFSVKTNCGLDPYIADHLVLSRDSSLVSWLSKTGRILQKPVTFTDSTAINIRKEMDLLQCSVSFPMIYKAKLIGIFNIDSKITDEPFYKEELEIIYLLCNYLAAAVKDIDLYHKMWYQKEFTKNIISSMGSGMVAINSDEKISIFNQQASDILGIDSSKIVGSDLRELPSPLGDILYETMVTGMAYKRHEVSINPSGLPLGINSYRLLDEQQKPIGAGILFTDLSDSKKLQAEQRRAEKLEAVNDLMGKIAHEIRNPLTSIHTYTQLINEKHKDDDLHGFYISTVSDSINKLDSLIDKLVAFSSTQDYNFNKEDINEVMREASNLISGSLPETHKFTKQLVDKVFFINSDKKLLIKAIHYLVLSIIDRTPEGASINLTTGAKMSDPSVIEITLSFAGDKVLEEGKQNLLKPLLDIQDLGVELNIPISHKIIDGHNGTLDIQSREGINSFVIRFPIIESKDAPISIEEGHVND
ncbi:MAG TPA: PAS domain-containing protein [Nitrospirae bacterium]|nr:sporulation kinase E [bacterium BMS3Abin09]GBE40646.1 sporulation kinase E [bacterium BMS3Bbin09]HDH33854.1 PAS domain-containing protein [Nitrospirota bacterium]HDZ84606.1 PAS domain-containing protein [Nitrospirota bacterium]